MDQQKVLTEAKTLAYSFLGAVLTGAGLAAAHWIGIELPHLVSFLTMAGGAYAGQKVAQ